MIPQPELGQLRKLGREILMSGTLVRKISWTDIIQHIRTKSEDPNFSKMQVARDCTAALALADQVGSEATANQFEKEFYDDPDLRETYVDLIRLTQHQLIRGFTQAVRALLPPNLIIKWEDRAKTDLSSEKTDPLVRPDQDDVHKYLHKPLVAYKPLKKPVSAVQIRNLRDYLYEARHPLDLIITPCAIKNSLFLGGVLSECIWATGLRPGEWRQAKILLGDPPDQHLADTRIRQTLAGMEAVSPDSPNEFRRHMNAAIEGVLSQSSTWLKVKSLKTRNRVAQIPEHRLLGLGNLPVSIRVTMYALIVAAGSLDKKTWGKFGRNAQRRTAKASKQILPEFGGKFSFLQLRNDFADRGRAVLDPYELAYMMGHSSLKSQKGYGRPGRSSRSGSRKPDMVIYVPSDEVQKTRLAIDTHVAAKKAATQKKQETVKVPGLTPDGEGSQA